MSALYTVVTVVILSIWLMLIPLTIYWIQEIYDQKATMIMQKRYIQLSLVSCYLNVIFMLCVVPLSICHRLLFSFEFIFSIVYHLTYIILSQCVLYTYLVRLFLLFFHLNWTQLTLSSNWIIHIRKPSAKDIKRQKEWEDSGNPSLTQNASDHIQQTITARESWFIRNRDKYGSLCSVLRKSYPLLLIMESLMILISVMIVYKWPLLSPNIHTIIHFVICLLSCIVSIYVWYKLPFDVSDDFFFKDEMIHLLQVNIATFTVLFIQMIASVITMFTSIGNINYIHIQSITNEVLVMLFCFANVYYQSQWVLKRIKNQNISLDCDLYNKPLAYQPCDTLQSPHVKQCTYNRSDAVCINSKSLEIINTNSKSLDIINTNNHDSDDANVIILKYRILFFTLQSRILLTDLAGYLARELSMECLFAFIEFTQFRDLIRRCGDIDLTLQLSQYNCGIDRNYTYGMAKLPRSISRASIVHNKKYARMQPQNRYRKIANKLTEKYLLSGAEFELPISRQRKNEVTEWIAIHSGVIDADVSFDKLYHLFEHCREEIYSLMADSCDRFVKKEAEKRYMMHMFDDGQKNVKHNKTKRLMCGCLKRKKKKKKQDVTVVKREIETNVTAIHADEHLPKEPQVKKHDDGIVATAIAAEIANYVQDDDIVVNTGD